MDSEKKRGEQNEEGEGKARLEKIVKENMQIEAEWGKKSILYGEER